MPRALWGASSLLWGQTWVPAWWSSCYLYGKRLTISVPTLDREDPYVTDKLFRHNMFCTVAGAAEGADMGSDQAGCGQGLSGQVTGDNLVVQWRVRTPSITPV